MRVIEGLSLISHSRCGERVNAPHIDARVIKAAFQRGRIILRRRRGDVVVVVVVVVVVIGAAISFIDDTHRPSHLLRSTSSGSGSGCSHRSSVALEPARLLGRAIVLTAAAAATATILAADFAFVGGS